jgi:hypothetical protein
MSQRLVPPEFMGRVASAGTMVTFGAQPVGALLGGLIAVSPLGLAGPWIVAALIRFAAAALSLTALKDCILTEMSFRSKSSAA